ncbi:MAG: C40 family peptidase [Flavobacteriales bacterium]|nr:C40 family peptidase [Flavobacteriales bacterium]
MRISLSIIFSILFSFSSVAQNNFEDKVEEFYCNSGIEIDSCTYTPLYLELMKWINAPYKYAGNSLSGIDCSGLVKNIYKSVFNVIVLGSSNNIYNQVIAIDNINDLVEGDLVFFKIAKNRISHIGIYLTNGFFIHSSVKKGVTVSNLNEEYYQKYFYSGGRIE